MMKPFRSLLAGLVAAGSATAQMSPTSTPPLPAGQPIRQIAFKMAPAMPETVTKVFDVSDLVCPPADSPLAKPGDDDAMKAAVAAFRTSRADQMMKVVRGTVQPDSWDDKGGSGKMDFQEVGTALVVSHSPAAVMAVADLLDSLRKLRNTSVQMELRLLTVPSGNAAVKKAFGDKATSPLTAEQLDELMEAIAGDRAVTVLQAPRMVAQNKQTATVQCGEKVAFVTGLITRIVDGKLVTIPESEFREIGLNSRITPDVSADGKSVRLRLDVTHSEAVRTAPLFPVTTLITPEFEGGSQGQPVPFTQFLQVPAIDTLKLETTVVLPAGGSMAFKVGKRKVEQRIESKVPVIGDLPYLGRLFRTRGVNMVDTDFIAVVTVRLVENAAKAVAVPAVMPVAFPQHIQLTPAPVPVCPPPVTVPQPATLTPAPVAVVPAKADVPVQLEMKFLSVPRENAALTKLMGEKGKATLTAEQLTAFLAELKNVETLGRPTLAVADKQTGFFQVGQQFPRLTGGGQAVQQVEYINTGLVARVTPELSADRKFIKMRLETTHTEPSRTPIDLGNGQKATPINTQSIEANLTLPVGGSAAVLVGTRKVDGKVPAFADLIVIVTVHLADAPAPLRIALPQPLPPVGPAWAPMPTPAVAPPRTLPVPVAPTVFPTMPVLLAPRGMVPPVAAMPVPTPRVVTTGSDGLERIGVDFHTTDLTPASRVLVGVASGKPMPADDTANLMTAYKAACAAGKKDEAARLAVQLLAKDPTYFGQGR